MPLLLSDSEDEEDEPDLPHPGNSALNTLFARLTPMDLGLRPTIPGAWLGYSGEQGEEEREEALNQLMEALAAQKEAEAAKVTSTPNEPALLTGEIPPVQ